MFTGFLRRPPRRSVRRHELGHRYCGNIVADVDAAATVFVHDAWDMFGLPGT